MVNILDGLIGKVLVNIKVQEYEIIFECSDGDKYKMYHEQDCCESVFIEDINGDLNNLLNNPLVMAEEVYESDENADESGTWTFYKFATINGYVTIRWYGMSNGYYCEIAEVRKIN